MIIALININGPLFRKIKLLTLVQDSSMEQKPEVVSVCKGTNNNPISNEKTRIFTPATCFLTLSL